MIWLIGSRLAAEQRPKTRLYRIVYLIINKIKPKIIFHCAGLSRPMSLHQSNISKSIDLNIIGTANVVKVCKKFNAVILDKSSKSVVIQVTALRRDIDLMSKNLKKFGLVSVSRTGAVAMTRGAEIFK